MKFDQQKYNRQSIRLKDYDYSQPGGYFITIVSHNRECLFGDVVGNKIILSPIGGIIESHWKSIPQHFPFVRLDSYQIMPNHIHGIINIVDNNVGAMHSIEGINKIVNKFPKNASPLRPIGTKSGSLGAIIQNFKSVTTRKINRINKTPAQKLWQRSFYDHVIINETELNNVREYIIYNPLRWELDKENPDVNM